MTRIFHSEGTGATVYVFANDHCPPHVHVRHRGNGWVARVKFSYLKADLELMSIGPAKRAPLQRAMNELLDDIRGGLRDCRRQWWLTNQTVCLTNQWVVLAASGKMALLSAPAARSKQIADAAFDASAERLRVWFRDGKATEMRVEL